jgi:outer membrane protein TolC
MAPATERTARPRRGVATLVTGWLLLASAAVSAQPAPLPRFDGPLGLEQAVDLAVEQSLRVKAANADARAMDSMRRETLAPFWPQVSANGYVSDQTLTPNVYWSAGSTMARNIQVFEANQTRDGNFTGMYSLFAGGRDYYGYKAAAARADAARQMRAGTQLDVGMQARLDYIAALRETENTRVTGDLRRQIEERLRVAHELLAVGRIPRYYILRDEAELANVLQMDAMARSRLEIALVALKTTLGLDLASAVTLTDRMEYAPVTLSVEEGIRRASESHPELLAAAKQRQAAEAEVRAAYGNYFPQVSLSAMYDFVWTRNRNEPSASDDGYSVGLVVTLPVFDGFMRESALRTARAKLDRAVQAEGLARQQVAKEVTQAALMLQAADTSVGASRKGVEQAAEEFRIVTERFEAGRGIQLEILDAQVTLTRLRFSAVSALAEYHSALAMWLKATGRVR